MDVNLKGGVDPFGECPGGELQRSEPQEFPGRLRQNAARQSVAPGQKLSTGYPQNNVFNYII